MRSGERVEQGIKQLESQNKRDRQSEKDQERD